MVVFSKYSYDEDLGKAARRQMEKIWPPAIPFINKQVEKKLKKMRKEDKDQEKKSDEDDDDETNFRTMKVPLDPDDLKHTSYMNVKSRLFDEGDVEEWIKWRIQVNDLIKMYGLDEDDPKRGKVIYSLLKGKAADWYVHHYRHLSEENKTREEDDRWSEDQILKRVLWHMSCQVFDRRVKSWRSAARKQKSYMRNSIYMGDMDPEDFLERLEELNKFLCYFPVDKGDGRQKYAKPFKQDELLEILDHAKKFEWHLTMLAQGKDPESFETVEEAMQYYRQLHQADQTFSKLKNHTTKGGKSGKKKRKRDDGSSKDGRGTNEGSNQNSNQAQNSNNNKSGKNSKFCVYCKKRGHTIDECRFKKAKEKDGKKKQKTNSSQNNFSKADFQNMMTNMVKALKESNKSKSKKRKQEEESDSEDSYDLNLFDKVEEEFYGSDNDSDSNTSSANVKMYSESTQNNKRDLEYDCHPFAKRPKVEKDEHKIYTTDIVVELKDRAGNVRPIRALLDTGTNATIVLRDFVAKGRIKSETKRRTKWKTLGGIFTTKYQSLIDFKFPELNQNKTITWAVHVDEKTSSKEASYDMIIGMDLMCEIGLQIDCQDKSIKWDGHEIPMKPRKLLQDAEVMHMLYQAATTPEALVDAELRQNRILDADYSKIEIDPFVQELNHLTPDQRQLLAQTLKKFPTLFSGGLGELKIPPISLELVEGAKPYHAKPFPIPKSLEHTTKTEMTRLTGIKVFDKNPDSEWAAPTFVQPKKTGDVRILTDFRRLNAVLKRKPFPLPKISDLLRKLEGFKWATAIDLSMGYYHIPLDKEARKLCTTILPWGKYQYRRLPMGIKTSPDIFQRIMNDLLGDIPNIQVYLDDILVTSNGTFEEHLQLLEKVLHRLQQANFRANLKKCFFAESQIEYWGYIISRDGIQPQPKKWKRSSGWPLQEPNVN